MSTDLRERLAALADAAGSVEPSRRTGLPPADLWRRGRRRQVRRALAATIAVAAVSAIAGIGGATAWQRIEVAEPVTSPDDSMRLPDRLYTPSPWLEGTDEAGPIGPLVAVIGAERRSWWSGSNGLVGVSGTTGEYRFLDLPDSAILDLGNGPADLALSPDGTMLAFWITGPTDQDPLLMTRGDRAVGGFAVYDTVTGEVQRKLLHSDHGLQTEGIAWSGDTVWFTYFTFNDGGVEPGGSSARFGAQVTWSPRTGDWSQQTDFRTAVDTASVATGLGSFVTSRGKGYVEVGPRGEVRRFRLDAPVYGSPSLSPSGARVAGIWQRDPASADNLEHELLVAELEPAATEGPARTRQVPGVRAPGGTVLGWRDEEHVVLAPRASAPGYVSVDVRSGESKPLLGSPTVTWTPGTTIAVEGLSAPVVPAQEPDWPTDPRLVALLITLAVAAGPAALWLWRRRGRA